MNNSQQAAEFHNGAPSSYTAKLREIQPEEVKRYSKNQEPPYHD